jgi:AraC family transcriptional regulator of adaptative response/methylated-DNA-[protein]-cysteine methyltransferase
MAIKTEAVRTNLNLVESICKYIAKQPSPPSLTELGNQYNLSHYHLQRIFKRVVGVTPKQYAEQHREQRLRKQLKSDKSVTNALYQSGYGSSAALYTNASSKFGMTPKNYKSGGQNLVIYFSITSSSLGKLLVAATSKGICMVSLADEEQSLLDALCSEFPQANISKDNKYLLKQVSIILQYLKGQEPHCDLPLDVRGTAFQKRVWDELKKIDYGTTCSYEQIAKRIGKPKAVRAVANACANNPTSLVVPCHRVIRKDGSLGGYRWDLKRKEALLKMEKTNKTIK